jgi:hypothetical protein
MGRWCSFRYSPNLGVILLTRWLTAFQQSIVEGHGERLAVTHREALRGVAHAEHG